MPLFLRRMCLSTFRKICVIICDSKLVSLLQEKRSNQEIVAELRKIIAMPSFFGNLLAVRLTDQKKIQKAELDEEFERARLLLLMAVQKDIEELEPQYKAHLMNSHK